MPRPTDKEIEEAVKEENAALMNFARVSHQETKLSQKKIAARKRLNLARDNKHDVIQRIMAL